MKWTPIYGIDLKAFINNFNERFRQLWYNISDENLKLSKVELYVLDSEPKTNGKVIIYYDSSGNLKLKTPDGTIKTITLS
jgi:hypothetical protein